MTPAICRANEGKTAIHSPRIVNIINFVRQCEPRIDRITKDVLYDTVASQIKILALDRGLGALESPLNGMSVVVQFDGTQV